METTIESSVHDFLIEAFFDGDNAAGLTHDLHLVENAILDSINVLRLVEFMEEEFDIMLEPEELHRLITVNEIAAVIRDKQG